uniref:Peptidase A1 domain-containing protein n=1 Tax=Capra hircus TaxID=9925 RepID=A0A452FH61_CAPHI
MKWLVLLDLVAFSDCRFIIPLTKVKIMRKILSEKNMLNNFLKEHISSRGSNITIHTLRNIMDVRFWEDGVLFDTCSFDLWVPSQFAPVQPVVIRFRHYKSPTFCPTKKTFSIVYGSGSMKGFLAYDTIQWEHSIIPLIGDLVSTYQPFGLSMAEYGFEGIPFNGILGLNYTNISFSGAIPIFDKMKNQDAISEPVFGKGSVAMLVPLIQAGDWSENMDLISMKRKVIACSGDCEAFVDTRTSLILGARRLVNNILDIIDATPWGCEHYVSCFAVNTLSSVILTINGINYPGPAQAYILKDSRGHCYTTFKENTVRTSRETWILDDVFLMLSFSVFGRENDRICLAQAV